MADLAKEIDDLKARVAALEDRSSTDAVGSSHDVMVQHTAMTGLFPVIARMSTVRLVRNIDLFGLFRGLLDVLAKIG